MLARILLDAHGFDGWVVCVHSVEKCGEGFNVRVAGPLTLDKGKAIEFMAKDAPAGRMFYFSSRYSEQLLYNRTRRNESVKGGKEWN